MAELPQYRREAQQSYEKKDYCGALAILEKALASRPSQDDLIAILDLRVSVYLKLDDKVSARKDATVMIRTNRADSRGYLRLGQLERLAGDNAGALKWYDHGLKKVPKGDRLHAYIVAQHTKTTGLVKAQTVFSKAADPLSKLPVEIVEMIVASLNYREAVVCLRVSKTWRQVLSTYSVLRNTLDFSCVGQGKLVSFAGIKAALGRSQKAEPPVVVIAANMTPPAARHLKQTMDRWIHYTKMSHFEVQHAAMDFVGYESLQWKRFNLRAVVFGGEHTVSLDTIYNILQSCEALERAVFSSIEPSKSIKAQSWAQSITVSRPALRSLTLAGAHHVDGIPYDFDIPVCTYLLWHVRAC